jgi:hypothetical protein
MATDARRQASQRLVKPPERRKSWRKWLLHGVPRCVQDARPLFVTDAARSVRWRTQQKIYFSLMCATANIAPPAPLLVSTRGKPSGCQETVK